MMIDDIFDNIIELGKQQVDKREEVRTFLSTIAFAKEHATVCLNTGRQSGKSIAIARRVSQNDVVITDSLSLIHI